MSKSQEKRIRYQKTGKLDDPIREAARAWLLKQYGYIYQGFLDDMTAHFKRELEKAVPAKEGPGGTAIDHGFIQGWNARGEALGLSQ